jgi:hypothetical protein
LKTSPAHEPTNEEDGDEDLQAKDDGVSGARAQGKCG